MGLDEVRKQIIEEAEQQTRLLLQDAHTESARIMSEAERGIKQYEKELRANAEKLIVTAERKELAAAEFEGKRMLLDKKKEMINKVIEEAKKELKHLHAEQRKAAVTKLLNMAKQEIEVKKVYINERDISYIKEKGIVTKEREMLGGLIAETSDGKISVDFSFETLLDEIKQTHLQQLSGVLFNE